MRQHYQSISLNFSHTIVELKLTYPDPPTRHFEDENRSSRHVGVAVAEAADYRQFFLPARDSSAEHHTAALK